MSDSLGNEALLKDHHHVAVNHHLPPHRWFDLRSFGLQVCKYVLLMCNCRSEFEPLSNGSSSDVYFSPVSSSTSLNAEPLTSVKQLPEQIDPLLDGEDKEKTAAYQLLQRAESKVSSL